VLEAPHGDPGGSTQHEEQGHEDELPAVPREEDHEEIPHGEELEERPARRDDQFPLEPQAFAVGNGQDDQDEEERQNEMQGPDVDDRLHCASSRILAASSASVSRMM